MRRVMLLGMFVLSIVAVGSAEEQIPKEIVQYYDDWNFVNYFSDRTEREILAVCENWEMVPELMKNARVQAVYLAMGRVEASTRTADSRTKTSKTPEDRPIISSAELMVPLGAVITSDGLSVEVGITPVIAEQQYNFIHNSERMKDPVDEYKKKVLNSHPERKSVRREIHRWTLAQGTWKKQEAPAATPAPSR
ncbi:MAG: hypothetical protein AB1714_00970 [Acidobacteriota bacterium]